MTDEVKAQDEKRLDDQDGPTPTEGPTVSQKSSQSSKTSQRDKGGSVTSERRSSRTSQGGEDKPPSQTGSNRASQEMDKASRSRTSQGGEDKPPSQTGSNRASQEMDKTSRSSRTSQGGEDKPPSQTGSHRASQEMDKTPSATEKDEVQVGSTQTLTQEGSTIKSGNDEKDEEFRFYLQFVKSLVFYIRDLNERGAVSSWILKLQKETSQPELRVEYVKLLLFCLQRRRLAPMFAEKPDDNTQLEPFPEGLQLNDMMRQIIENDRNAENGQGDESVVSETSADMKEYVAIQKIPCYGVHCYMAVSDEPLNKWDHYVKQSTSVEKTQKLDKDCEGLPAARPPGSKEPDFNNFDQERRDSERKGEETAPQTRLAGGGGGGAPTRQQCCRIFTPSSSFYNESEMEDDYLVVDGDEIKPSYAPITTRLRHKNRPPKFHAEGPESRASQRTVREENMVDARGNVIKSTILGQGVTGSYKDPRDGVTVRMRKTMAARDFDAPQGKSKCFTNFPRLKVETPRQRQQQKQVYEPAYEYVTCPKHPSRSWNYQSPPQARCSRERNANYPYPEDEFDEDFSEYDERIVCPARWQ